MVEGEVHRIIRRHLPPLKERMKIEKSGGQGEGTE